MQPMKNELNQRWVASIGAPDLVPYQGWRPCMEWCCNTFGYNQTGNVGSGPTWSYVGEGVFEFEIKQEYLLFMLKWS